MKPRLACADFTFPLLKHDDVLGLISTLGFEAVDIGLFESRSHLQPSKIFRGIPKSAAALSRKLDSEGLAPADIFMHPATDFESLALNHPDAAVRKKLRAVFLKTLEFTHACGGRHITILPGARFAAEPIKVSMQRCADELAWRIGQTSGTGIAISVEAHIGSVIPSPETALKLLQMTPGLTLTLDYCHFTRTGMPDARIEPLVKHATHFHVRGSRKGRLQASFQKNTVDYRRVWKVMKATGYKGYLGIEYVWIDWEHCNEVDNLSETILFRDFLKAF